MKDNEEKKKVVRNYILLGFIFVVSIGAVLYFCQLYKVSDEERKKVPIISGLLQEIYHDDLEHYIMDNPTTIIYMCIANGDVCRNFERDFKKLLKKKEYNQIIYLNLTDLDQEEFIKDFNSVYQYKNRLTSYYPAFVLFEDGKVKNILQGSEDKPLTISKVRHFLELNEIGE